MNSCRTRRCNRAILPLEPLEPRQMLTTFGDVNGDAVFDSSDLVAVYSVGEYEDGVECNSTYNEGDWNGDCEFTTRDISLAFQRGIYGGVQYPRLFFGPDDIAGLRAKLDVPVYGTMFQRELDFALDRLATDYSDSNLLEREKALDAARLSFVVLLLEHDDPNRAAIAEKTRQILLHINEGLWDATNGFPRRNIGWDGGEELHQWYVGGILRDYSAAYDWLAGAGELEGEARAIVKFRILRLTQLEHEIQMTPQKDRDRTIYAHRKSNYGLRSLGGVGFAALTFPEQVGLLDDPQGLMDPAVATPFDTQATLRRVMNELFVDVSTEFPGNQIDEGQLEHYVSPDGFYGEGFTYQNDVFGVMTPFLVAYHKVTGLDYLSDDGVFDGRIGNMFENDVRVMLPNQRRPTVGDAFHGKFYLYHQMMAEYTRNPDVSHWYVEEVFRRTGGTFGFTLPFYRDDPTPLPEPNYRTEFMMDTGFAVFRDKWGPDATYMMLNAQGRPTYGHDQADQGSFTLYAHGEYLVVDPGYGAAYGNDPDGPEYLGGPWNWTTSGLGHSGVTVDSLYAFGETPIEDLRATVHPRVDIQSYVDPKDPAQLQDPIAARDIDYVMAVVDYEVVGAQLHRAVAFPRHQYFIIEDVMTADAIHDYGWQLHLGDSTRGELTNEANEYVWSTVNSEDDPVGLGIKMLSNNRNVQSYENGPTNLGGYSFPEHVFDHTYIIADQTAKDTRFLTILDPHQMHGSELTATSIIADRAWKIEHSPTQYDILISQVEPRSIRVGHLETDAEFVVASIDVIDGEEVLRSVVARGGTQFVANYDSDVRFPLETESVFLFESTDPRFSAE